MKILITGGAGFIGSHIAEHYVGAGDEVIVLDNLSTGKRKNLETFADKVEFVEGDIRDVALIRDLAKGCELIYHEAAVVSVPYSVEHPQETHDVNIQGTFNVLQAAQDQGVRRVVFASSAAIYGDDPELPKRERMVPAPISPYGIEKITGEHYCSVFNQLYGVETVSLRYFNVFGPRQDPKSPYSGVISIFVDKLLAHASPTIFGDGEQYRDFVYIANVVQANVLAGKVPEAAGKVFNVGCGHQTTVNQLLSTLVKVTGSEAKATYAESRSGDIRESVADISQARSQLDYDPKIDVEEGLRHLVDYERGQRD